MPAVSNESVAIVKQTTKVCLGNSNEGDEKFGLNGKGPSGL